MLAFNFVSSNLKMEGRVSVCVLFQVLSQVRDRVQYGSKAGQFQVGMAEREAQSFPDLFNPMM